MIRLFPPLSFPFLRAAGAGRHGLRACRRPAEAAAHRRDSRPWPTKRPKSHRAGPQQGLEVKLVEFNDWVLPNIAVADGSVDANFFQHEPFLQLLTRAEA